MTGTNAYCDKAAAADLRKVVAEENTALVRLIGSGNYHYMSCFFLEQIREPCSLVLCDHHTDMLPARFPELLSCGCWVKRALDECPDIREVLIIGAREDLIGAVEKKYRSRVFCYSDKKIGGNDDWIPFALSHVHYPVYLSLDKDVFTPAIVDTNWDQGRLTLEQFQKMVSCLFNKGAVLGVDICGENPKADQKRNNAFNRKLLHYLEAENKPLSMAV